MGYFMSIRSPAVMCASILPVTQTAVVAVQHVTFFFFFFLLSLCISAGCACLNRVSDSTETSCVDGDYTLALRLEFLQVTAVSLHVLFQHTQTGSK